MKTSIKLSNIARKVLLSCGFLASLLNFGTDILTGLLWKGYSFNAQSISELSAIGAPTRSFILPLYITYDILMIAFGLGVGLLTYQKRAQRATVGFIIGSAVIHLVVSLFFPMHLGVDVKKATNTMNIVFMATSVTFFLLAIGFGAFIYRNWFRFYSIGTLLSYIVLGIFGYLSTTQIYAEQRVSLVGVQERIMLYGYLLWVMLLAICLLMSKKNHSSTKVSD